VRDVDALQAADQSLKILEGHPASFCVRVLDELPRGDAFLLERIAIAHGHRLILRRLPVDRDPVGSARFILAAVTPADRSAVVVEHVEMAAEVVMNAMGELGHAVLVQRAGTRPP